MVSMVAARGQEERSGDGGREEDGVGLNGSGSGQENQGGVYRRGGEWTGKVRVQVPGCEYQPTGQEGSR